MAGHGRPRAAPVDHEVMALGLAADGFIKRSIDGGVVRFSPADHGFQIGLVFLAQAHEQLPGRRQPHAVAAFAKVVRERRDEAQLQAKLLNMDIARRATGAVRQIGERVALRQIVAHARQRQILVHPVLADLAQRHGFDQRQIMATGSGELHQRFDFIGIFMGQCHGVEFHLQPGGRGSRDAIKHLGQAAPAGDAGEFFSVQRVDADVDAAHPSGKQRLGMARHLAAIAGEREFFECARLQVSAKAVHQVDDATPHQWLAAGQPQLAGAAPDEGAGDAVDLLQAQHFVLGQEGHVFGHAIDTAEIAAIGDRDTQISNGAAERIDQRPFRCAHRAVAFAKHEPSLWHGCIGWQALFALTLRPLDCRAGQAQSRSSSKHAV